jgi:hypothetical protein
VIGALKDAIHKAGRAYVARLCRLEAAAQTFAANERSVGFSFVFRHLTLLRPVEVVDVEAGPSALPQLLRECGYLVTALGEKGAFNRHYAVSGSLGELPLQSALRCDVAISVLSLQAMAEADVAVSKMFGMLPPGGHLMLVVPYNETSPLEDVYALPEAAWRRGGAVRARIFSRADAVRWAEKNCATLASQEFWECFTGRFWRCGEHVRPPRQTSAGEPHQLSCLLYRKETLPGED